MLQLGRWRPRHTSAQPRQRPDKHRQPKQSRQQGLKPAAVWCKLGVSSGVGVSGVSSVSSVSECRAFLAPLTLLTRVDTVRAPGLSRMSVDSVDSVEAVSGWCRLTLVSSVSSVSRVCRECVENVSRVSSQGSMSYPQRATCCLATRGRSRAPRWLDAQLVAPPYFSHKSRARRRRSHHGGRPGIPLQTCPFPRALLPLRGRALRHEQPVDAEATGL